MKTKFLTGIALLGLTTVLLTGCGKEPVAEIDAAKAAVEQAKTAGADVYVHESYVVLQDSLNGVMSTIESQKSKLFKNYSTAKEHLAGVTQFAGEVAQQAETRKEEMKVEVQNTIAEVKLLIQSNRQLILEAPKGKEGASTLIAIEGEVNAIEQLVADAGTMYDSGEYIATLDKAKVAKEKATAINTELSGVIAKYKANVKGKKA